MNAGDHGYTRVMVVNATRPTRPDIVIGAVQPVEESDPTPPEVPPPHREPPENEPVTPIFPDMPPPEPAPPETEPEPV